jgi:hypothetical protein
MVETGNADGRIHELFAESLELQGKLDEAVEAYRSGMEQNPEDWELHRSLFQCLWQSVGDRAGALEVLDSWLERHPGDASVRRARASYAESLGVSTPS